MSESGMRQNLVKALKPFDAVPVENRLRAGHPDVNATCFDMECKWMKVWPKNCDVNPVRFPHSLTKEQGIWLARRWSRGGLTFVAVQVAREWFFFSGETAKDTFGTMTRPEMREEAMLHFRSGLEKERLVEWLRSQILLRVNGF